jgi:hypothetical protein
MSEATVEAVLQDLNARGITTLEQFVESKVRMQKPQRIDTEEAVEEGLAQPTPPDPSYKSTIGVPDPSVAIVLDGKRVDYDAVAKLDNQPLGYIATTLEGGKQALVISSDPSIVNTRRLGQFRNPLDAIRGSVEKSLTSVGLRPAVAQADGQIGVRIYTDHFYEGDSTVLAPEWYISDLREFDAGLGAFGGNWGDKISSIEVLGHCRWQGWEMRDRGGSWIIGDSWREFDSVGWNDDISSIETWYVN